MYKNKSDSDDSEMEIFVEEELRNGLLSIKNTGKVLNNESRKPEGKGGEKITIFDRLGKKDRHEKPYSRKPVGSVFTRLEDKKEPTDLLNTPNKQHRLFTHFNASCGQRPERKSAKNPMVKIGHRYPTPSYDATSFEYLPDQEMEIRKYEEHVRKMDEQRQLYAHVDTTNANRHERSVVMRPRAERVVQYEFAHKPPEVEILESLEGFEGPEMIEKTKAEIKDIMQKNFPKAREEVYEELITDEPMPMNTTEHARIFIRLCQEQTNNPTLAKLNQICAAAHVQVMRELNRM